MFQITFNAFFTIYISFTLLALISIWLYSYHQKKNKIIFPEHQRLLVCEYCHFPYLVDSFKKLSSCPQCGLYNQSPKVDK